MKTSILFLGLLSVIATTMAAVGTPNNVGAPAAVQAVPPTLAQDLEDLTNLVPMKMIMKLMERYLLNDEEFQGVVRTINSYNAFVVRMRFNSQPEVIAFHSWVRTQLLLSGEFELDESLELNIFRMSPYWANSVWGWQGFINELMSYYPLELLQAHIDMKVAENGSFAQFWTRLNGLKVVYERVIAFPETQRLITQLQGQGVDIQQLDYIIRTIFGWMNAPAPASAAAAAAAPVAPAVAPAQPIQTPFAFNYNG